MVEVLKKMFAVAIGLALTACTMPVPILKGEPIVPPVPKATTVEIPVPPLRIENTLYDSINSTIPPKDSKRIELFPMVDTIEYEADKPAITTLSKLITSRISLRYHHLRDKKECHWHGIKGFECHYDNKLDKTGSMTFGLDSTFSFSPTWNLVFSSSPYYEGPDDMSGWATLALTYLARKFDAKASDTGLREKAQTAWKSMNIPIKLGDSIWLVIDPTEMWTTPITVRDHALAFSLGLKAKPRIVYDTPAITDPALAAWRERPSQGGKFVMSLEARLGFGEAQQFLKQAMHGLDLTSRMGSVQIEDVTISAQNSSILIGLKVKSLIYNGWIYMTGVLEYNEISGALLVRNLKLNVPTFNPIVRFIASFFKGRFEAEVESLAHWQIQGASDTLIDQAEKRFAEASKGTLGLNIFGIEPMVDDKTGHQILFTSKDAIHVAVTAYGQIYYRPVAVNQN